MKKLFFMTLMVALCATLGCAKTADEVKTDNATMANNNAIPVNHTQAEEGILEFVDSVSLSVTTREFVARDYFGIKNTAVKMNLQQGFKDLFLGKKESATDKTTTLRRHWLRVTSKNEPIIAELGGTAKAEITLAEFYALLKRQGHGETGVLNTSGRTNVFYMRDVNNTLRAVPTSWVDDVWTIDAFPAFEWSCCNWFGDSHFQIFSH